MQVIKNIFVALVLVGLGAVLGMSVGCLYGSRYMVEQREVHSLDVTPVTLKVGDNYGAQVTAPVHMLEPKVSDAYLQYGHNDIKTANPQIVGENE